MPKSSNTLSRIYDYSQSDLESNRQGRLSPDQARKAASILHKQNVWTLRAGLLGLLFLAVILFWNHATAADPRQALLMDGLSVLLILGLLAALLWSGYFRTRHLRNQVVSVLNGKPILYTRPARGPQVKYYLLTFGDGRLYFELTCEQWKALDPQSGYTLYFIKLTFHNILLSIEKDPSP